MRRLLATLLTSLLLLNSCGYFRAVDPNYCKAWWIDEIDREFADAARADLDRLRANGCEKAVIEINSAGGSVVYTLEVVRLMRAAEHDGLILETRGGAVVASGATFLLAAGSVGYRYVHRHTFAVVHGPRINSFLESKCITYVQNPRNEDEKVWNQILDTMSAVYSERSGFPVIITREWLTCGKELVGTGKLLVDLRLADYVIEDRDRG